MKAVERCLAYLEKLPPAIAHSGGHNATLRAACECVRLGLSDSEIAEAMNWWNANKCQPQWSAKELAHKIQDAKRKAVHGERVMLAQHHKPTVKPVTADELRARRLARKQSPSKAALPSTTTAPAPLAADDTLIERVWNAWRADPDKGNDEKHARRFARASIVADWPFYDESGRDLGAVGWCAWAGLPLSEIHRLPVTAPTALTPKHTLTTSNPTTPDTLTTATRIERTTVNADDDADYWQHVLAGAEEAAAFAEA